MLEPIIGYSEFVSPADDKAKDILYHVEWLTDEQSFPSLSPSPFIKNKNSSIMDWQFIEEKEVDQLPGITISSIESPDGLAEFWEYVQHTGQNGSFVELATNAQYQLAGTDPIYPFSPIHPHSAYITRKAKTTIANIDMQDEDDYYHLYENRKSHGSHSYFGNKNYFNRKKIIAYSEFWDYWGCGKPEINDRYLHQCVAFQSHAKYYKPPGPRNANKNKKDRNLKPQNRLEL
ncbi:hypothetical protein BCR42DRAFT_409787 [Absidia repens]|uniref:Uncharacterized protein n=1 Tax=Absidia repens TaxID=90262 RepID=A0A1X2IN44_9FUNG|nr:hypothetical protein BCR42DRAFT_409787 [Absidia repens]